MIVFGDVNPSSSLSLFFDIYIYNIYIYYHVIIIVIIILLFTKVSGSIINLTVITKQNMMNISLQAL